jgi:ATP-dependent Clp protease protease subunit
LRIKKKLYQIYEKHTGSSLKQTERMMERDKFMGPEEARKIGLVDRVIAERKDIKIESIRVEQKVLSSGLLHLLLLCMMLIFNFWFN